LCNFAIRFNSGVINPNLKWPFPAIRPHLPCSPKIAPNSPSQSLFSHFLNKFTGIWPIFDRLLASKRFSPCLILANPAIRFPSFLPAGKTQNSPNYPAFGPSRPFAPIHGSIIFSSEKSVFSRPPPTLKFSPRQPQLLEFFHFCANILKRESQCRIKDEEAACLPRT
jgi:hypothetical protein